MEKGHFCPFIIYFLIVFYKRIKMFDFTRQIKSIFFQKLLALQYLFQFSLIISKYH